MCIGDTLTVVVAVLALAPVGVLHFMAQTINRIF